MDNPNEYTALTMAKEYMDERLKYEKTRKMLHSIKVKKKGRIFIGYCKVLSSIGHALIVFGKRLEKFRLATEVEQ